MATILIDGIQSCLDVDCRPLYYVFEGACAVSNTAAGKEKLSVLLGKASAMKSLVSDEGSVDCVSPCDASGSFNEPFFSTFKSAAEI